MYSFASPLAMAPLSGSPEINEGKGSHPVTRRVADGPNQRDRGTPYPGLLPTPSLTAQTTEREGERALLRVPSPVLVHPPAHLYPISPPSTYMLHPVEHTGGPAIQPSLFSIQLPPPASLSSAERGRGREREAVTRPRNLAFPPRGPSLSRAPTPLKLRVHFQPQSTGSRLGHAPRRDNWQSYRIIHRLPTLHAKSETGGRLRE